MDLILAGETVEYLYRHKIGSSEGMIFLVENTTKKGSGAITRC
jgi:hypothetical protein